MKRINMPGFTADASLFTIDRYYQQTMALWPTNLDGVQPASCYNTCIGLCFSGVEACHRSGVLDLAGAYALH
jgi:hypothetical protein